MTAIRMIPISKIRVLNPRARNKAKFSDIVANIAALGLKKPITVSPRDDDSGAYDLVCGQGRLEAFQALGQEEVPALVRDVPRHDRFIMSLVESIARCHPIKKYRLGTLAEGLPDSGSGRKGAADGAMSQAGSSLSAQLIFSVFLGASSP